MFRRNLKILLSNSFFLFGARGTGKSTFVRQQLNLPDSHLVDLLDPATLRRYTRDPGRLLADLQGIKSVQPIKWIVIDEVQKIPELLDVVHKAIEEHGFRFALTGSSARKLKRGSANMLAGRAFVYHLFPLTMNEVAGHHDVTEILKWGSLPKTLSYPSDAERVKYLESYTHTYLQEEILQEQLVRKIEPFRALLDVAGQMSGDLLNFTSIAKEVGIDVKTVQTYFDILEDTLLGTKLPAFHYSTRKRLRSSPKFYLFDLGVKRLLDGGIAAGAQPWGNELGDLFEQLVILEAHRLNSYLGKQYQLSFLRVDEQQEIDLVVKPPRGKPILVEIKATADVGEKHLKNLRSFRSDFSESPAYLLSQDPIPRKEDGVLIVPWQEGLRRIFGSLTGPQ